MELFLLFAIPTGFLVSLGILILSKTFPLQICSAVVFIATSTIIAWIVGAIQNFGSAWSGGSREDAGTYGLVGFCISVLVSLFAIRLRRYLTRAQQAADGNHH